MRSAPPPHRPLAPRRHDPLEIEPHRRRTPRARPLDERPRHRRRLALHQRLGDLGRPVPRPQNPPPRVPRPPLPKPPGPIPPHLLLQGINRHPPRLGTTGIHRGGNRLTRLRHELGNFWYGRDSAREPTQYPLCADSSHIGTTIRATNIRRIRTTVRTVWQTRSY